MYDSRVLRVVFAEDNYLVREGTVALLQEAGDVEIVGTAATFDELLAAVGELTPDAVLTDIRMPPSGTDEGIRAAKRIRADHADIGAGPEARGPRFFTVTEEPQRWLVRQVLDDPAGDHDWAIHAEVDLAASDEEGAAVVWVTAVEAMGGF